jgi:hypothetical protein
MKNAIIFTLVLLSCVLSLIWLFLRIRDQYRLHKSRSEAESKAAKAANSPQPFGFNRVIELNMERVNEIGLDEAMRERARQIASLN